MSYIIVLELRRLLINQINITSFLDKYCGVFSFRHYYYLWTSALMYHDHDPGCLILLSVSLDRTAVGQLISVSIFLKPTLRKDLDY